MGFNIQTIGSFAKEEKTLPLLHLSHRENEPEAEARRESLLAFAHILEAGYPDLVQVYAARGIHHIGRWGVSEEEANWITEVLCNASKPKGSRHDLARCQAAMSALARFAVGPSDGPRAAKAFRTCLLRETEDRKPIAELASAAAVRMSEDPKSRAFALMLAPQLFTCLLQTECGPHGRRRPRSGPGFPAALGT